MNSDPAASSGGPAGPRCHPCRHFAVSWDPRLPYACTRMGFKSRILPALEVLRASGMPCRGFEPKPGHPMNGAAACVRPAGPAAPAERPAVSTFRRQA